MSATVRPHGEEPWVSLDDHGPPPARCAYCGIGERAIRVLAQPGAYLAGEWLCLPCYDDVHMTEPLDPLLARWAGTTDG